MAAILKNELYKLSLYITYTATAWLKTYKYTPILLKSDKCIYFFSKNDIYMGKWQPS